MSVWTECPWIDKRELQNLLLLRFFDERSLYKAFEDIGEYTDDMNIHFD